MGRRPLGFGCACLTRGSFESSVSCRRGCVGGSPAPSGRGLGRLTQGCWAPRKPLAQEMLFPISTSQWGETLAGVKTDRPRSNFHSGQSTPSLPIATPALGSAPLHLGPCLRDLPRYRIPQDWIADPTFPQVAHPLGNVERGFSGVYDQTAASDWVTLCSFRFQRAGQKTARLGDER